MIQFDIDQSYIPEGERLPEALLHTFSKAFNAQMPMEKDGIISIVFSSDEEVQRLNRMYRGKDSTTDVLAFDYLDEGNMSDQIGDVIISYPQAQRQADGDLRLEIVDLMVHGSLHVLGYDHIQAEDAKRMFPLQDKMVSLIV